MKHGSLFSGIGGFDLAAEYMDWENVFHCEIEPFPRKVLEYYWPNAKSYEDIKKTDFTIHRGRIDVLSGGFPCQPYSAAGKRLGKEDERHLWPEMLRAIREIQPKWVVGENVLGIVSWDEGLVFHEIQTDLEAEGYEVQPYVLPAVSVNAPHRRDRVWFIAYRKDVANPNSSGRKGQRQFTEPKGEKGTSGDGGGRSVTDTESKGLEGFGKHREVGSAKGRSERKGVSGELDGGNCEPNVDNASSVRRNGAGINENGNTKEKIREASEREFVGANGENDWWGEWPTQPPICSRNDGLSTILDGITFPKWRTESIKGYGNAIVPQVAMQIFKAIEAYNELTENEET